MLKMKRMLMVAGMTAAMAAGSAMGQNGRTGEPPDDSEAGAPPECKMKNLDTAWGCLSCYGTLLTNCAKLPRDGTQQACQAGAGIFLKWCLGRLKKDADDTDSEWVNSQWEEFQSWPVGTQLERPFIWPEGADRIETWVRIEGEQEHNKTPIVEQQPDGSWNVIIDWPEMSLGDNGSVGIGLVWFDGETPVEAMADVVLLTSDMDGDGEVRGDDLEIILHNFATGRLDMRELIRALR